MSAKHTPGKWVYDPSRPRHCVNTESGRHVALVSAMVTRSDEHDENIANARLIAASPCLLEALEEVEQEAKLRSEMDYYERLRGSTFGIAAESDNEARAWQARQRKIEEIVVRRRAAIARATGGTDAA